MRSFLSFFLVVAAASAFVVRPAVQQSCHQSVACYMFSTDEDQKSPTPANAAAAPLSLESDNSAPAVQGETKNYARNLNTGEVVEVKWNDPAMEANTNPFKMDWWAYILFGFPFVLLADDAFHFLGPLKDGPLGFLIH